MEEEVEEEEEEEEEVPTQTLTLGRYVKDQSESSVWKKDQS